MHSFGPKSSVTFAYNWNLHMHCYTYHVILIRQQKCWNYSLYFDLEEVYSAIETATYWLLWPAPRRWGTPDSCMPWKKVPNKLLPFFPLNIFCITNQYGKSAKELSNFINTRSFKKETESNWIIYSKQVLGACRSTCVQTHKNRKQTQIRNFVKFSFH